MKVTTTTATTFKFSRDEIKEILFDYLIRKQHINQKASLNNVTLTDIQSTRVEPGGYPQDGYTEEYFDGIMLSINKKGEVNFLTDTKDQNG